MPFKFLDLGNRQIAENVSFHGLPSASLPNDPSFMASLSLVMLLAQTFHSWPKPFRSSASRKRDFGPVY